MEAALGLDRACFQQLLDMTASEDRARLLGYLRDDLDSLTAGIETALEGPLPDPARLRAESHVLSALAGSVGAMAVHDRARALNAAAHEGEAGEHRRLAEEAATGARHLARYLERHMSGLAVAP